MGLNAPVRSRDGAPVGLGFAPRSRRQVVKICMNNLPTERLAVTTDVQNSLQHFQGGGASAPLAHACERPWYSRIMNLMV